MITKIMDLPMHDHPPKRILNITKNHRLKINILELLVKVLQSVERFHQLPETYNLHKHSA